MVRVAGLACYVLFKMLQVKVRCCDLIRLSAALFSSRHPPLHTDPSILSSMLYNILLVLIRRDRSQRTDSDCFLVDMLQLTVNCSGKILVFNDVSSDILVEDLLSLIREKSATPHSAQLKSQSTGCLLKPFESLQEV